jgi:hypothetical protein
MSGQSSDAITHNRAQWRPTAHGYEPWGCRVGLEFPVVKLLDYDEDSEGLKKNQNPFALVVLAHLQMLSTRHDPKQRLESKLALVRMFYERGYARQDILELFRFIDWAIVLPEELETDFADAVSRYEEAPFSHSP